jgi:glutamine synthetase
MDAENVAVFEKHHVLSKAELEARTEILLEAYSMQINIEAMTMLNIAKRQIFPAAVKYSGNLADIAILVKDARGSNGTQQRLLDRVCDLIDSLEEGIAKLEDAVEKTSKETGEKQAELCRDIVLKAMDDVRCAADKLELLVDADLWPLPTYAEMLFLN